MSRTLCVWYRPWRERVFCFLADNTPTKAGSCGSHPPGSHPPVSHTEDAAFYWFLDFVAAAAEGTRGFVYLVTIRSSPLPIDPHCNDTEEGMKHCSRKPEQNGYTAYALVTSKAALHLCCSPVTSEAASLGVYPAVRRTFPDMNGESCACTELGKSPRACALCAGDGESMFPGT